MYDDSEYFIHICNYDQLFCRRIWLTALKEEQAQLLQKVCAATEQDAEEERGVGEGGLQVTGTANW